MKRHLWLQADILSILAILLGMSLATTGFAKSYSIDQIKIHARIDGDGSLWISEDRMYYFRGSFSWADYELPLRQLGPVTDFSLSENELEYQQMEGGAPGTYTVSSTDERFYVRWNYRASHEKRTFTLRYRVTDAVRRYRDVAEFYYQFVGKANQVEIGEVKVVLELPQPADTSQVRAWAHGPLHGQLAFENGKIRLWVAPLPKRTWWEARVIFPLDWVTGGPMRMDRTMRETILSEERLLAEAANARRLAQQRKIAFREQHQSLALSTSMILAVIGFAVLMWLYSRFGQPYAIPGQGRIVSEIPQDLSPAVANYLHSNGQMGAGALIATIFDLARRGYLQLQETIQEKKILFGKYRKKIYTLQLMKDNYERDRNDLSAHEREMVDFLFADLAEGRSEIQMDELKDSRRDVTKWFSQWKKSVVQAWGGSGFYEKQSIMGTVIAAVTAIIILIAGVLLMIRLGPGGLIAMIAGIVLFVLSFAILKYTREVKQMKSQLSAFRRYLTQYHFRRDSSYLQSNLDRFLIYGIALGVGSKVIKEMVALVPDWQAAGYFPWYVGTMSSGSPAGFAESVSSMVTSMGATMSSAAGIGGGAAAGGGAGAGGASGGAG
ncbi:MAG: DUF2207 domain-containing protein [candidate division KSB1 bacterium]|nr:DUF2207 domain-containing protein [candidate division KSB1 bacterium]